MIEGEKRADISLNIGFHGLLAEEEEPKIAMYLIDANGRIQKKLASAEKGKIALEAKIGEDPQRVVALGPDLEDLEQVNTKDLLHFRIGEAWPEWMKKKTILIPREWWEPWWPVLLCLSGRIRKCWPIIFEPGPTKNLGGISLGPHLPTMPHCSPICNGVVEVYKRDFCCLPWIHRNISDLIKKLKDIAKERALLKLQTLEPDAYSAEPELESAVLPPDRETARRLKLAEASRIMPMTPDLAGPTLEDVKALEALPQTEAIQYLKDRPSLWYFPCISSVRKLGEVALGPDGHFTFCYTLFKGIFIFKCWTSYFYKVKQWQDNQWVYIYDGFAANQHFTAGQTADLKTLKGRACVEDDPDVPHQKPFCMLQDIGLTHSWRLVSHWFGKDASGLDKTQISDNGVAFPLPDNGGLVDPPSAGATSALALVNRPWGEVLSFRLFFDPDMKSIDACYYRICFVKAGSDGKPLSGNTPTVLSNPVSWLKFVSLGGVIQIKGEGLGPETKNGEPGLFRIPYRQDALWLEGQYHQSWDTRQYENGKYLLTVEVFDSAGKPLDTSKFDYLRWLEEEGADSVAKVPYDKLVHLFWIDNQPCYADIVDLCKDHVPSSEECQFITGNAATQFSARFRAYHATQNSATAPETFMYYYVLWYHRGLNGPSRIIEKSGLNKPPSLFEGSPAESTPLTFGSMLDDLPKCTFAINLDVYAKHTNGIRILDEYNKYDQAAFSLESKNPISGVIVPLSKNE